MQTIKSSSNQLLTQKRALQAEYISTLLLNVEDT